MRNKILQITLLCILVCSLQQVNAQDFSLIRSRISQGIFSEKGKHLNANQIGNYIQTLQSNGSWIGINYDDTSVVNWKPIDHLKRLEVMGVAYTFPESSYFNNIELKSKIEKGLHFWYQKKPRSNNWWYKDVLSPKYLGEILILMSVSSTPMDSIIRNEIISMMESIPNPENLPINKATGLFRNNIYRAVIKEDNQLLTRSLEYLYKPVALTQEEEGIHYDYSYLHHGPQLHISSYGTTFIDRLYGVSFWLVGTSYALPQEKADILNKFFFESYVGGIRGRYMDFNLEGRGISRMRYLDKYWLMDEQNDNNLLSQIAVVAGDSYELEVGNLKKRLSNPNDISLGISPKHTYFWRGDYTQHVRPEYSFNVRGVSTRTYRTERGNDENILGGVLPDGATNIQVFGDEYYNIMPVWEWDKIPGVTAKDYNFDKEMTVNWGEFGSTTFVGGVSDGTYGASVYTQDYDGVTAKKSYFFFDEAVVCLGADINATGAENITTTINQTFSKGDVFSLKNGAVSQLNTNGGVTTEAIWHNHVTYVFPNQTSVQLSNQTQSGSWYRVNENHSNNPTQSKVFKLWFDHGVSPINASYSYIVLPATTKESLINNYAQQNIEIIRNDAQIQAVQDKRLEITQVVFYQAGTLNFGEESISVDKPCILQVRHLADNKVDVSIADPNQNETETSINVTYINSGVQNTKAFTMPVAPYRGKTVQARFQSVCSKPPKLDGTVLPTKVGITTLNRTDNWIVNSRNGFIKLESNNKPFVITRLTTNERNNINNPVEGMIIWDKDKQCLEMYKDFGLGETWECIKQGCNE
ncbi:hypothetical protein KRX57_00295 [Weeksellaceae bacterium TAE3-ERU29]|nr:hypothetical protein [Weeksellaceae bacterium TAE3-ERU29]